MTSALIETLQTDDRVLCWTADAADNLHWATHPHEQRHVEARWMRRGDYVRCRWQRVGTTVTWESQHDLAWLALALATAKDPVFRRRGRIRVG